MRCNESTQTARVFQNFDYEYQARGPVRVERWTLDVERFLPSMVGKMIDMKKQVRKTQATETQRPNSGRRWHGNFSENAHDAGSHRR